MTERLSLSLGHYRVTTKVGIFAKFGVRKLVNDDQGALGQWLQKGSVSFGGVLGSGLCFCGLGKRGLGQDSTVPLGLPKKMVRTQAWLKEGSLAVRTKGREGWGLQTTGSFQLTLGSSSQNMDITQEPERSLGHCPCPLPSPSQEAQLFALAFFSPKSSYICPCPHAWVPLSL